MNKKTKTAIVEECLISLSTGDISSMDLLYKTLKTDVYAFALSKTCNKFDADDILQDVFIRIYENAKLYTPLGKPMAWIFKIEINLINRYFQLKNKKALSTDDIILNTFSNNIASIEEKIAKKDYLNTLLKNLNDFEREIISLHIVSNLKFREISNLLDKPLSTILSKYNRAIKKLQKVIKEGK